tara:strand:- start:394 stop:600 length:207 start_codon:yes stop_codon:yes gene_type:complete
MFKNMEFTKEELQEVKDLIADMLEFMYNSLTDHPEIEIYNLSMYNTTRLKKIILLINNKIKHYEKRNY